MICLFDLASMSSEVWSERQGDNMTVWNNGTVRSDSNDIASIERKLRKRNRSLGLWLGK
jgi:hypothetical protein